MLQTKLTDICVLIIGFLLLTPEIILSNAENTDEIPTDKPTTSGVVMTENTKMVATTTTEPSPTTSTTILETTRTEELEFAENQTGIDNFTLKSNLSPTQKPVLQAVFDPIADCDCISYNDIASSNLSCSVVMNMTDSASGLYGMLISGVLLVIILVIMILVMVFQPRECKCHRERVDETLRKTY